MIFQFPSGYGGFVLEFPLVVVYDRLGPQMASTVA